MDRATQLRHLEEAERHIALGERHIAEQEARLLDLERHGQDATVARELLKTFFATQEQHVAHRDLILKELGY